MKTKILIILIILICLGVGGFFVYQNIFGPEVEKEKAPIDRINQNIPSYLLYQSKLEEIPEQHLLVWNEKLNTDLIFWRDSEFYCRFSNEKAQKVEYFYRNPGPDVEGGWHYRYALICGDNYWIVNGADWFGVKIYGLFEK